MLRYLLLELVRAVVLPLDEPLHRRSRRRLHMRGEVTQHLVRRRHAAQHARRVDVLGVIRGARDVVSLVEMLGGRIVASLTTNS